MQLKAHTRLIQATSVLCAFLLTPGDMTPILAQETSAPQSGATLLSPAQLDSLVAPIALYPDPLLAQVLAASTYPLEISQLSQWLTSHPNLKDQALADAVMKQPWDPSVQALAALPEVVNKLASNIQWTTDLGDAVMDQQGDVMDAVQRMRARAQTSGHLKSNDHMTVETQTVGSKQVIVIEQANPQVIYVPTYNPVAIWGPSPYFAYPPLFYPPGMALSFGVGVAMGAFWGGGWGWGPGWGGNNIIINNNRFTRNNWARGDRNWRHNPERGRGGRSNWANRERGGNRERGANRGRGNNVGAANRERGGNRERGANRGRGNNMGNANRAGVNRGGNRERGANRGRGNNMGNANRAGVNRGGNRGRGANNMGSANRGGGNRRQATRGGGNRGNRGAANRSMAGANRGGARGGGARGGARGGGGGRRR